MSIGYVRDWMIFSLPYLSMDERENKKNKGKKKEQSLGLLKCVNPLQMNARGGIYGGERD